MHAASLFCPSTDDLLARVVCNSAREQNAQPTDALPVVKSPGGRWRAASREGCAAAFSTRGGNAMEGTLANLIVQLIAGAIGGTAAGSALKDLSMGKAGDAISGAVGGGIVGQILAAVLNSPEAAAAVQGIDIGAIVKDLVGGGVGGAVVTALVGAIRNAMA